MVSHRRRVRNELVRAVAAAPSLQDRDTWSLFLQELSITLGSGVLAAGQDTYPGRVIRVVNYCLRHADGMRSIAESVMLLDPAGTETDRILRWVDEWHVAELFSDVDILWLREELFACEPTGDLYRWAIEIRMSEQPGYCRTVWQLFASLAGENAAGGVLPCLRFLERVGPWLSAEGSARLEELMVMLSVQWELADAPADPPAAAAPPVDMAYLIIQFDKYGGDGDSYLVSHWRQWTTVWRPVKGEDRRVDEADLEATVEAIVAEVERGWAEHLGPMTIEFILPDSLLDLPVEEFRRELDSVEAAPLATKYPVYVRSLNRLRSTEWHRVWRTRWQQRATAQIADMVLHCAADGSGAVQVEASLDGGTVVMMLSVPPLPGSAGERQLLAGLRAGLPAVMWHRRTYPHSQRCATVTSMIGNALLGAGLSELPVHVAELRRQAWGQLPEQRNFHVGNGIVMLWDDPDRLPDRPAARTSNGEVHG